MSEPERANLYNVEHAGGPTPPPSAAGAPPEAEVDAQDVDKAEAKPVPLSEWPPRPKIPTRDSALRRVVTEWMDARRDLRDPQYVDLLLIKAMLRRHYNTLSSQLSRNGVLTKAEGKPKAALNALLSIASEIRRIDGALPDTPPPAAVRYVTGRCERCPCEGCTNAREEFRKRLVERDGHTLNIDDMEGLREADCQLVGAATEVAQKLSMDLDEVIRAAMEHEAEKRELAKLRREVALLRTREAAVTAARGDAP